MAGGGGSVGKQGKLRDWGTVAREYMKMARKTSLPGRPAPSSAGMCVGGEDGRCMPVWGAKTFEALVYDVENRRHVEGCKGLCSVQSIYIIEKPGIMDSVSSLSMLN